MIELVKFYFVYSSCRSILIWGFLLLSHYSTRAMCIIIRWSYNQTLHVGNFQKNEYT
jgi:hypothetical protein